MTKEDEKASYIRRENEEREAAKTASDPAARDAHYVMAERYAGRAAMLEDQHFQDSAASASQLRYARPS